MRVLVAGRNAKILAKAAGTLANDLKIHTAATKADCLTLLQRTEFDLIVACETLADGSGLEVLSHVAVNTPNTLRIFAARPATLNLLKGELGLFGLFRTLPYPINFQKLWAAISLARSTCGEGTTAAPAAPPRVATDATPPMRHVVLEETWEAEELARSAAGASQRSAVAPVPAGHSTAGKEPQPRATPRSQKQAAAPAATRASATPLRQQTQQHSQAPQSSPPATQQRPTAQRSQGQQPAQPLKQQARTQRPQLSEVPQQARPAKQPPPQARPPRQPQPEVTSGMRAAARYAAAHAARDMAADMATPPTRIPESDAFKRARARRDSTGRREPVMSNDSLAQLAKLATTRRSTPVFRGAPTDKKRAAFFVGSGVFAATALAVLTFVMVNANRPMERSKLPLMASINQPMPRKVFPWQPETQQPTRQAAFMKSEVPASAVADLEAEAEAASETFDGEPGHPGPPPPYSPPPPSEPPSLESSEQSMDQ
jgi:hypothetical protein